MLAGGIGLRQDWNSAKARVTPAHHLLTLSERRLKVKERKRIIKRNLSGSNLSCDKAQQRLKRLAVLGVVCAVVIGVYAWIGYSCPMDALGSGPRDSDYNLLVRGFRDGQLNLKREAPPGLVNPNNPADVDLSKMFGLTDLSYYKGKLYLYFGATPALALFWPCVALTGHYLSASRCGGDFFLGGFSGGGGFALGGLAALLSGSRFCGGGWREHWRWGWPILRRRYWGGAMFMKWRSVAGMR